jgi:hypothetical protein
LKFGEKDALFLSSSSQLALFHATPVGPGLLKTGEHAQSLWRQNDLQRTGFVALYLLCRFSFSVIATICSTVCFSAVLLCLDLREDLWMSLSSLICVQVSS